MRTDLLDVAPQSVVAPERDAAIAWLVDNAEAYRATVRAIESATRSIWLTQLAFDADCLVYDHPTDASDGETSSPRLLDAVLAASARGVAVRVILNETLLLDTTTPFRAAVQGIAGVDVRVRGIRRFPQLLHAKMLIVDEREALLLGSPFVNGYWDDDRHLPTDARRPARELGGRPLHDLSLRITGAAVRTLGSIFAEMWNDVSAGSETDSPIECRAERQPVRSGQMAIARTAPRDVLRRRPEGATEILSAIERGIASARQLIYIEHQYLSSRRVIAALARALARQPQLEVVIVLNQNPDVTAYRGWQNARLRQAGLLEHPRVGIFALWRAVPADEDRHDWTVNQLFIHSKALIIDDQWLTVGSANLDGVSLHSYGHDFTGRLGRRIFRGVRNFDVNAVVWGDRESPDNPVRDLRERLWAEHLGSDAAGLDPRVLEGSLAQWRASAASGTARLSEPPLPDDGGNEGLSIVLPYSMRSRPVDQLRDCGVRAVERIDLRFDPGWLERHFSPNWVRNMFA